EHGGASARHCHARGVKPDGEQHSTLGVDQMAGREIPGISGAVKKRSPLAGFQRLRDRLRVVPSLQAAFAGHGEEHPFATWPQLRAVPPSPCFPFTSVSGVPPLAGTRMIPPAPWPTRMPVSSQLMPKRPAANGQSVTAAPPVTATRLSAPISPNASDCPSGE